MSLYYREHAPAAALAALVRCYWTVTGIGLPGVTRVNRVLPDGCMDIIFSLEDDGPGSRVVGAMLEASVFHLHGPVDMLGVRFVPGAAPLFLGSSASDLTTHVIPADNLWKDADALAGRLLEIRDHSERLRLLNSVLLERLNPRRMSPAALQGMALIERARGQLRLDLLCRSLNVSERTLQRVFATQVGLTPKQAIRVMRFRGAIQLMQVNPRATLAQIALQCGYSDQAHFTREFRELAAATPMEYRRERGLVGFIQDEHTAGQ